MELKRYNFNKGTDNIYLFISTDLSESDIEGKIKYFDNCLQSEQKALSLPTMYQWFKNIFANDNLEYALMGHAYYNGYKSVKFADDKLVEYHQDCQMIDDDGQAESFALDYHASDLKIEVNGLEKLKMGNVINQMIAEALDTIVNLNNIKAHKLMTTDKRLISLYKIFYGQDPDFSLPYTNRLINSMLYILHKNNISFLYKYQEIDFDDDKEAIYDIGLNELLASLKGKMGPYDFALNKQLPAKVIKQVETIKNIVNSYTSDLTEEGLVNYLEDVCRLYAKKGNSTEDLGNGLTLLRTIQNDLKI